uniref:Uncharacterized protein n=1 Tax=Oryza sativa subsp. japonica TaxID=39947 RepID=Q8GSD4_ORYSJ|nr:hypothetical protein [Oryza sativa Japonica Group]BAD30203.1 hypothetical protein [Oryza sativa Japonica Group]
MGGNRALQVAMGSQSIVQLGLSMFLPMFMGIGLEKAKIQALVDRTDQAWHQGARSSLAVIHVRISVCRASRFGCRQRRSARWVPEPSTVHLPTRYSKQAFFCEDVLGNSKV